MKENKSEVKYYSKKNFFFLNNIYFKNLVDPASSHMLVSKIKPCMSKFKY